MSDPQWQPIDAVMSDKITDHGFVPSKRPDSCDWAEYPKAGRWTVCDYPAMAHAKPAGMSPAEPVYVILTDECFDGQHDRCTGKLPEGYWGAECGCDCHREG